MKKSKICPKCNGTDILRVEGKAGTYGSCNNIMTGMTIFLQSWSIDMSVVTVGTAKSGSIKKISRS